MKYVYNTRNNLSSTGHSRPSAVASKVFFTKLFSKPKTNSASQTGRAIANALLGAEGLLAEIG